MGRGGQRGGFGCIWLQCFSSLKNEIWGKNIHIFQIGAVGISCIVAIYIFSFCMFEIFCDMFSCWKEGERGTEGKQGEREGGREVFVLTYGALLTASPRVSQFLKIINN